MAYTIHKSDGTAISIADNAIDDVFYNSSGGSTGAGLGVQLVGRNTVGYGAAIAQNILQMTENFCSSITAYPSDTTALQGQLWFNRLSTSSGNLYIRIAEGTTLGSGLANWQKLVTVSNSETGTIPVVNPSGTAIDGDMQVVGSVISMYAGGSWRQIFPAIYS
jgi:hypothetical protein